MSITETTRRNITDFLRLERIQWHGRMEEIQFLQRIFNLSSLPSNDGRHKDAEGDIWRHRVLNPEDWEDDWIYGDSRFNLLYCSDDIFLNFLCEMIHPLVRPESDEVERLLKFFNENLANEGWKIVETMRLGGKPIFSARQAISLPVATLEVVTNALNTDYLMQQVTRMQSEIDADPTLAIGTAKEFVETICKTILNVRGVSYDKNLEIQPLVKLTCKTLKLVREDIPDETKAADTVRNLLSNLAVISQYLAELRNPYGTGHGKEASFKGLQPQHQLLSELRIKLLRLHKLLLDTERLIYEQVRGQVSSGELLQLVINHDQFTWLHRLSELIVQIDDLLQADEPVTSEVIAALVSDVRILLTPDELGDDFAMKYDAAFQRHPDVVLAHADVVTLLATDSHQ